VNEGMRDKLASPRNNDAADGSRLVETARDANERRVDYTFVLTRAEPRALRRRPGRQAPTRGCSSTWAGIDGWISRWARFTPDAGQGWIEATLGHPRQPPVEEALTAATGRAS